MADTLKQITDAFNDVLPPGVKRAADIIGQELEEVNAARQSNKFDFLSVGEKSKAFKMDKQGLWLGSDKFEDAPFKIDMDGNIYMKASQGDGYLQISSDLSQILVHDGSDNRVFIGHDSTNDLFGIRVSQDGKDVFSDGLRDMVMDSRNNMFKIIHDGTTSISVPAGGASWTAGSVNKVHSVDIDFDGIPAIDGSDSDMPKILVYKKRTSGQLEPLPYSYGVQSTSGAGIEVEQRDTFLILPPSVRLNTNGALRIYHEFYGYSSGSGGSGGAYTLNYNYSVLRETATP